MKVFSYIVIAIGCVIIFAMALSPADPSTSPSSGTSSAPATPTSGGPSF